MDSARSVDKQCVRERVCISPPLFLSSPSISASSLYQRSLFLTYFLVPFPTLPFLRWVTISRKGRLFCKSAKLVKVISGTELVAKTELSRGDIEYR